METKQERVLAYKLARTIDKDELADVAGGAIMTGKQSVRPSGVIGNWDVSWDVSVDW